MMPALIVVAGAPASGKTTLARRIATDLRVLLLEKDAIKESLARSLGATDRDASRRIGRASVRLLWDLAAQQLARGVDVMMECNFDRSFARDDLRHLASMSRILIVQCAADPAVIERRYRDRAGRGERDAAHFDLDALPDLLAGLTDSRFDLTDLEYEAVVVATDDGWQPAVEAIVTHIQRHITFR